MSRKEKRFVGTTYAFHHSFSSVHSSHTSSSILLLCFIANAYLYTFSPATIVHFNRTKSKAEQIYLKHLWSLSFTCIEPLRQPAIASAVPIILPMFGSTSTSFFARIVFFTQSTHTHPRGRGREKKREREKTTGFRIATIHFSIYTSTTQLIVFNLRYRHDESTECSLRSIYRRFDDDKKRNKERTASVGQWER